MIIITSDQEINIKGLDSLKPKEEGQRYVYKYPLIKFQENTNIKHLTILDISISDNNLYLMFDGSYWADILYENNLSKSIEIIDLIVSAFSGGIELFIFAQALANQLVTYGYNPNLVVRCAADICRNTLIFPPAFTNSEYWQVYHLEDPPTDLGGDVKQLYEQVSKCGQLFWQGKDIENWLKNPRHIFAGVKIPKENFITKKKALKRVAFILQEENKKRKIGNKNDTITRKQAFFQ